jgi:hypothetical protein
MRGDRWRFARHVACVVIVAIGASSAAIADPPVLLQGTLTVPPSADSSDKNQPSAPASQTKSEGLGQRSDKEVGPGEQLGFRQEQVAEEMRELEQRMYRLAETLKMLEPENSSRLMLGLKYAREELILHQMQETQAALAKLALSGAVDEQKQLLAKLERLQQLLLSTDLDFEMRLERLRQIREVLRKLDSVIKEEAREEKTSKQAAARQRELDELAKRRAALEQLIKQQTAHVDANAPLAKKQELADVDREAATKLGEAQKATHKETQALAGNAEAGGSSKNLTSAAGNMQSAADALAKTSPSDAQQPMQKALDELKQELDDVAKREAAAKEALAKEQFEAMRKDQEGNRRSTEDVNELTRQLGDNGTAALTELTKAMGAMSAAEGAFGAGKAGAGNGEQGKALGALKFAEELLAEEAERLARQLRREVKKRVTEGLTLMLEEQVAVRQRTSALTAGVKEGSRQALSALAALAKREEKITGIAQEMINIVEETEFGIALPAALAAVRDATEAVHMSLAEGDASAEVVKAEQQIEADLKEMLEVVSAMSDANNRKGRRGNGGSPEDQRKEQNRIISELKMIRLLQVRVEQSTVDVDKKRASTALSAAIRKRVEALEGRQEDIADATQRLAEERADDIPVPEN